MERLKGVVAGAVKAVVSFRMASQPEEMGRNAAPSGTVAYL